MKVELGKMDYGQGLVGFLVNSMVGDSSLKFGPEDEGVVAITTRITPSDKKLLEQFSEVGNVSQSVITRICIEIGLKRISELLVEVKKAKEEAAALESAEYQARAEYDEEAEAAEIVDTLSELRKAAAARKAAKK